ncbi:SGNH/GDSL hydrolase family protein [uncultured Aeromicrobium sp.]|uniref:SGNH/GDSL hydrolase family protein n=1 Tax=uncultured Aeromicrobium sp. TaxID=337820 RepID=UPI0025F0D9FB|nr:SGNH/GDSL hydrolase family protein [uncultured Aeromicrobium sp.]
MAILARSSLAVAAGLGMLAAGTGVLVALALQPPPVPEGAGSDPTRLASSPRTPAAQETSAPARDAGPSLMFIGDEHLDEWAPAAAGELSADVRVESGVTLLGDPAVADVLTGEPPNVVVLSIGAADVAWADDFQFGLTTAVDAVQSTWPDAQVVLMRPAWPDPGDLEAEKNQIVEQVAAARGATYLDADPTAADFLAAWDAAGL